MQLLNINFEELTEMNVSELNSIFIKLSSYIIFIINLNKFKYRYFIILLKSYLMNQKNNQNLVDVEHLSLAFLYLLKKYHY